MDQLKLRTIVFPKLFSFTAAWNMCLIVITHNLLSMADFDAIFVMHEGQIAHRGTHYELLEQKAEEYCNLLGIQSDSVEMISPRHSLSRAFTPRPY
jgi:ABC-type transport system involved in cytochrome bd biosynthesis fused ATPase/permease subunit